MELLHGRDMEHGLTSRLGVVGTINNGGQALLKAGKVLDLYR